MATNLAVPSRKISPKCIFSGTNVYDVRHALSISIVRRQEVLFFLRQPGHPVFTYIGKAQRSDPFQQISVVGLRIMCEAEEEISCDESSRAPYLRLNTIDQASFCDMFETNESLYCFELFDDCERYQIFSFRRDLGHLFFTCVVPLFMGNIVSAI